MRKGFTLIELLVVIAIIAILMGMIRPMLTASASKAREFECESHLKQIGIAMRAYTEDYGTFPKNLSALDPVLQDKDLLYCPATSHEYSYHAPGKDVDRDAVIVSCINPKAGHKYPHRFNGSYLVLTAGGKVERTRE